MNVVILNEVRSKNVCERGQLYVVNEWAEEIRSGINERRSNDSHSARFSPCFLNGATKFMNESGR